jgi:hypothetical protein
VLSARSELPMVTDFTTDGRRGDGNSAIQEMRSD